MNVSESNVEKTTKLVREWLEERDNGRGEAHFYARDLVEDRDITPRRAGRALSKLRDDGMDGIEVEEWGGNRGTLWRVAYK